MAYNSSGVFSRVHDFTDDRDNGIRIQASRMDAEMDGIATGLSTAITKDGTQTTTAKIPFAVGLSASFKRERGLSVSISQASSSVITISRV